MNWDHTEFLYGHKVTQKEVDNAINSGLQIVTDRQNLDFVEPILLRNNYKIASEKYEMTGHNDLYQYLFIKK